MRTLHHLPLSPACREVRLALAEKKLEAQLLGEESWADGEAFLKLNPAGTVPILVEEDGFSVPDRAAILEYLEDAYPAVPLLPGGPRGRSEVRRLMAWFDAKFSHEVSTPVLYEKVDKRLLRLGAPDMNAVRAALTHLREHLEYLATLIEARRWLAGDELSYADIAAAAHLSCLDYLGDVPWAHHQGVREWYARLKSRPSFRPLLADNIPGMPPPRHYTDLDF